MLFRSDSANCFSYAAMYNFVLKFLHEVILPFDDGYLVGIICNGRFHCLSVSNSVLFISHTCVATLS